MIDRYKHLNTTCPISICGIEQIAEVVVQENYGTHRMLSALARIRLAKDPDDKLAIVLRDALNRGLF